MYFATSSLNLRAKVTFPFASAKKKQFPPPPRSQDSPPSLERREKTWLLMDIHISYSNKVTLQAIFEREELAGNKKGNKKPSMLATTCWNW